MRKLALAFVMATLVLGLLSVAALAETPYPGVPEEVRAYEGNPADARVWRLNDGWETYCNLDRQEEVTIKANVAQWAKWSADFEGWEWYVRKPGDYYADCIQAKIQSNGSVAINFVGFDNLTAEEGTNVVEGADGFIATYYYASMGTSIPTVEDWFAATALDTVVFEDSFALHCGLSFKLWNRIVVVDCNSPGVYSNYPTLELTLLNQVDWLDDEGEFVAPSAPYLLDV